MNTHLIFTLKRSQSRSRSRPAANIQILTIQRRNSLQIKELISSQVVYKTTVNYDNLK